MSTAIKALTTRDSGGRVLIDRKPLCLPHAHAYKRDAHESWTVEFDSVGFVTECVRCEYERYS